MKAGHGIKRRSLHQELAENLGEMIVSGALAPGSKVQELRLCEELGVSRTPMREALKVLAADGLVVLEPNRGSWVSPITVEDLDEVFPVMGALEALAGELACAKATDREIAEIAALDGRMLAHYQHRELDGYFEVNQEIHEAILAAARNATLTAQYRSLALRVRRARYVANMTEERWRQATQEHAEILERLEARDAAGLGRILKTHLQNKLETVKAWLADQGTSSAS